MDFGVYDDVPTALVFSPDRMIYLVNSIDKC